MNIEEYISSGILESYVLGTLTEKEAEDVESMAAEYPLIADEITDIQVALENYALKHSVKPSDNVKKKLFAELESRESTSTVEIPNTISFQPAKQSNFNWLVAASLTAAVISTTTSVYFWNQWKNSEGRIVALQQENQTYAYNTNLIIQSNEQQLKERSQYFSFVRDTSTVRVALKGVPLSPSSGALVFWNKQSNEVYIDIQSLPAPPAGMQYQLWALDNGVPVDAGVFTFNNTLSTFQKMKGIKHAQAFAVTLEKEGGVASPTLSAMYVLGTI